MTVQEFVSLCVESGLLQVTLYDTATGADVWSGDGYGIDDCEYCNYEVASFDLPKDESITLNIDTDSVT